MWATSGGDRSVLVAALMITQSFLYSAIFFTSGLVLEYYFKVKPTGTGYYFFAYPGNLAGHCCSGACSTPSAGRR